MPKILSDRIVWDEDDWLGGLTPQAKLNTPSSMGNGSSYQRDINPFRELGSIVPGFNPNYLAVGNVATVTAIIKAGDVDYSSSTPYAYLIGDDDVHKLNINPANISYTEPWPHTITHGGHTNIVGQDLKIFNIMNGVTSVSSTMALYSFSDATDGDVGAYDISSGALNVFYDNFLSTQPTGSSVLTTDPHPMIFGDDGSLYIGNGRTLMKLDGEVGGNGTLTTKLTFPRGTIIRSFSKNQDYLVIFVSRSNQQSSSYYRGNSLAYFWNYTSDNYNFSYDLSDNMVTAGFNWLGTIGCFTYGRSSDGGYDATKLKLFTGGKFEQVAEYQAYPPNNNGVEIFDNMIVWSFTDGTQSWVGSYGSPWNNRIKSGLNFWGQPSGTSSGICINFNSSRLFVSSGVGATGGLEMFFSGFNPTSLNNSYFQGVIGRPSFPFQTRGKIKSVKIHFKRTATAGRTLELKLFIDGISNSSTIFTGLGTFTELTKEYFKDSSNIELPHFHYIWPQFTWDIGTNGTDAPAVNKLEVFFEPIKFIQ